MSNSNILTIDAIKIYFNMIPKQSITIDDLLQVIDVESMEIRQVKFYMATLSDSKNYFKGFLIPQNKFIGVNNILNLKAISVLTKNKYFLVMDFSVYDEKIRHRIGDPKAIMQEQKNGTSNENLNSNIDSNLNSNLNNTSFNQQYNGERMSN